MGVLYPLLPGDPTNCMHFVGSTIRDSSPTRNREHSS